MDIKHEFDGQVLVLHPAQNNGLLVDDDDVNLVKYILGLLNRVNYEPGTRVILDLSEKKYLQSSGLGQLVKLKDGLIDSHIELVIRNASPAVVSLFTMVGLNAFFTIE